MLALKASLPLILLQYHVARLKMPKRNIAKYGIETGASDKHCSLFKERFIHLYAQIFRALTLTH
jgi:hypothetical protein